MNSVADAPSASSGHHSPDSQGNPSLRPEAEPLNRWAPALLLLGAAALYLIRLGWVGLFDPCEGMYAEIPREMIVLKDWITPHFNFVRYFEKPPLIYWLNAVAFKLLGFSEFSARLPTAAAAIAGIGFVYAIGRDLWGRRAGLAAGAILGTSFGWFIFGRLNLPDMLFTALLTGAFWGFSRVLLSKEPRPAAILGGYAAMAAAVMAKGLIGVVFPVLTVGAFIVFSRDWQLVRRMKLIQGGLLFLAITAPWHILMAEKNPGFLWFFFVNEHLSRFIGSRQADYSAVPLTTYLALTAVWFCPWIIFLPAALRRCCSRATDDGRMDRGVLFVLCWAGAVIGFFALSPARLEYYALPALPALALCVGRLWDLEIATPRKRIRAGGLLPAWIALIIFSVGLIPAANLFPRLEHMQFYNMFQGSGSAAGSVSDPTMAAAKINIVPAFADLVPLFKIVVALIVVGTGLSALAWFRHRPGLALICLVGALVVGFATIEKGFLLFSPYRSVAHLGSLLRSELQPGDQIIVDRNYEYHAAIDFYTGQRARVYRGARGDLLYGCSHYPEAAGTFVSEEEFAQLWRGPGRVFLLSDAPDGLAQLRALVPNTIVLGRTGSNWLFANRAETKPPSQAKLPRQRKLDAIVKKGGACRPDALKWRTQNKRVRDDAFHLFVLGNTPMSI
ncbi:MAG TPA: glycosyltransferase family 39 protein [Opitutaceae bacterium]|nr:glycosyltransferase family 39 protein [Opitutaceae bacterium]